MTDSQRQERLDSIISGLIKLKTRTELVGKEDTKDFDSFLFETDRLVGDWRRAVQTN